METIAQHPLKVMETSVHSHFHHLDQKKRPLKVNGRCRLASYILLLVPYLAVLKTLFRSQVSLPGCGFFGGGRTVR